MVSRRPKRVYIAFDYKNDKALKSFVRGQARNPDTPFKITDYSLKEAAPERNWEKKARVKIRRSDMVMVVAGQKTYRASGVRREVKIAREEGKPVVQIKGHKDKKCPRVPEAGVKYRWTRENLKRILK